MRLLPVKFYNPSAPGSPAKLSSRRSGPRVRTGGSGTVLTRSDLKRTQSRRPGTRYVGLRVVPDHRNLPGRET